MAETENLDVASSGAKGPLTREEAIAYVRAKWQEALDDPRPSVPMERVMEPLIAKYQALADAEEASQKRAS